MTELRCVTPEWQALEQSLRNALAAIAASQKAMAEAIEESPQDALVFWRLLSQATRADDQPWSRLAFVVAQPAELPVLADSYNDFGDYLADVGYRRVDRQVEELQLRKRRHS